MENDTFLNLLTSRAHWEFEILLIFIFDVLIGLLIWPWLRHLYHDHQLFHMKTYKVSKKEMIAEHKRIIPELKKAGLKKEAGRQAKELSKIKKK